MNSDQKAKKKWRQQHPDYHREYQAKFRKTIRGHLTRVFSDIKQRCTNPDCIIYKYYGGRGIENRFNSSKEFFDYVVNVLKVDPRGLDIDRINNNGHYEKGNIRFVTHKENCNNREKKKGLTEREAEAIRLVHHDFMGLSRKETAKLMEISEQRLSSILQSVKIKAPQMFPILTNSQRIIREMIMDDGNDRQAIADRLDWPIKKVDAIIAQLRAKGISLTVPKTVRYEPHMDGQVKRRF